MTDNPVIMEMDNLPDQKRTPLDSSENSPPGLTVTVPRKRTNRGVSEIDEDDRPDELDSPNGIDDGLLDNNGGTSKRTNGDKKPNSNGGFGFPGYESPRTIMIDGIETQIPDVNAYQHKKTLAQGMMDLALLSANANQLRYVLESYKRHPYFYPSIFFISISIIFQIVVGIGLILNSRYNIKDERDICKANKINNLTIIGIFVVTVVNVFISSFGVADAPDGV